MAKKILLVEGEADKGFYSSVCREAGLGVTVTVGRPQELGGVGSGKGNALSLLPTLLDQLYDGQISQLAMVIDADFKEADGLGVSDSLKQVVDILKGRNYSVSSKLKAGGYIFNHPDGLPDFGLWIMPDNKSDGLLEDFIMKSVVADQIGLLDLAKKSVNGLKMPLFKAIHKSKAHVATWMAWQKVPGQSIQGAVGGKLLNLTTGEGHNFITWLKAIYQ